MADMLKLTEILRVTRNAEGGISRVTVRVREAETDALNVEEAKSILLREADEAKSILLREADEAKSILLRDAEVRYQSVLDLLDLNSTANGPVKSAKANTLLSTMPIDTLLAIRRMDDARTAARTVLKNALQKGFSDLPGDVLPLVLATIKTMSELGGVDEVVVKLRAFAKVIDDFCEVVMAIESDHVKIITGQLTLVVNNKA